MEVLVRVDAGFLGSSPAGGVDSSGNLGGIVLLDPVYEERDGVLGAFDAAEGCCGAFGAGGGDFEGTVIGD